MVVLKEKFSYINLQYDRILADHLSSHKGDLKIFSTENFLRTLTDTENTNTVFCPMLMDYHHRLEGLLICITTDYDTWNKLTHWTIIA